MILIYSAGRRKHVVDWLPSKRAKRTNHTGYDRQMTVVNWQPTLNS